MWEPRDETARLLMTCLLRHVVAIKRPLFPYQSTTRLSHSLHAQAFFFLHTTASFLRARPCVSLPYLASQPRLETWTEQRATARPSSVIVEPRSCCEPRRVAASVYNIFGSRLQWRVQQSSARRTAVYRVGASIVAVVVGAYNKPYRFLASSVVRTRKKAKAITVIVLDGGGCATLAHKSSAPSWATRVHALTASVAAA